MVLGLAHAVRKRPRRRWKKMEAAVTMLYTLYTAEGFVFAADRQISGPGKAFDPQNKVARIAQLGVARGGGLIGYYGLAYVRGRPMDQWIRRLISGWTGSKYARDFAEYLISRISAQATRDELSAVSGFHLGAFEERDGVAVPVFLFIRNTRDFADGRHFNVGEFQAEEQLLARQPLDGLPMPMIREALRDQQVRHGFPYWFRNGDVPYFGAMSSALEAALDHLLGQGSIFRAPLSLGGWEQLGETLVTSAGRLYRVYYAGTPPVGRGRIVKSVSWPV
jgi:hypothetical protein